MARLVLIFVISLTASLAWGAPNNNSEYVNDEWDDVWSDWGTPTDEIPKNDQQPNNNVGGGKAGEPNAAAADGTMPQGDSFLPSGGDGGGFGSGDQKRVQFRLVRDGFAEPEGVRKYRPTYGKRKRL